MLKKRMRMGQGDHRQRLKNPLKLKKNGIKAWRAGAWTLAIGRKGSEHEKQGQLERAGLGGEETILWRGGD